MDAAPQGVLAQLLLILLAGLAGGSLARRAGLPAVVGELLAGALVVPAVLAALAPGAPTGPFPGMAPAAAVRDVVGRLGLLFFLFLAGAEVDPSYLRGRGRAAAGISLGGMLPPFLLGIGLAFLFPEAAGPGVGQLHLALVLGVAMAISALPVLARILADLGLLRTPLGTLVLAAAMVDDLCGWLLFSWLLGAAGPEGQPASGWRIVAAVLLPALLLVLALAATAPLRRDRCAPCRGLAAAARLPVAVPVLLGLAWASEAAGVHAAPVAFLWGLVVGAVGRDGPDGPRALAPAVAYFFSPLYFASVGLRIHPVGHADAVLVLAVTAVATAGKLIGVTAGARLAGLTRREALAAALAMNARGAVGITLASVALDAGLISPSLFVALVVMALVTSALAGPAVSLALGLGRRG